jgi:glycosyltransferase involved in cell wall biosynthesis
LTLAFGGRPDFGDFLTSGICYYVIKIFMKALAISIIIPAYNESGYLRACLDAISRQVEPPLEVLLVDNNSTDDTVAIAKDYKFVRVLHEKRQGQVYAQATGFDAAKGDILGRIDADTVIATDWTKRVRLQFEDSRVIAITGSGEPYDVPLKYVGMAIMAFYLYFMSWVLTGKRMLWGANCAIRVTGWRTIRNEMHFRRDIWEDYDMSFHLADHGRVIAVLGLVVGASFRSGHKSFAGLCSYQFRAIRTVRLHAGLARTVLFCIGWAPMALLYPVTVVDKFLLKARDKQE